MQTTILGIALALTLGSIPAASATELRILDLLGNPAAARRLKPDQVRETARCRAITGRSREVTAGARFFNG